VSEPQETVNYGGETFAVSTPAAPTRKRGRETVRDMVISLAVVGSVIAALFLVTYRPKPDAGPKPVDWQTTAATARGQSPFPLATPTGLPATWIGTSARFATTAKSQGHPVWHLGFVTGGQKYAGLEQSDQDATVFVRDQIDGGQPQGAVTIKGQSWQSFGPGASGYRSLVRPAAGSTLVVQGNAVESELEQLAAAITTP